MALYGERLSHVEESEHRRGVSNLGSAALESGEIGRALRLRGKSLSLYDEPGDKKNALRRCTRK